MVFVPGSGNPQAFERVGRVGDAGCLGGVGVLTTLRRMSTLSSALGFSVFLAAGITFG